MKTGIEKFKNVIDPDTCNFIIKGIESNIDNATDASHAYGQHVIAKELPVISTELNSIIHNSVSKAVEQYRDMYTYLIVSRDTGYNLRRISGATRAHIDSGAGRDSRNVSIIVGLNSDYEEGTFHFPVQDFSTTVKQGEAILFPVWFMYPHYVDAPIGFRYTINTWLQY
jgi:hypothetical protein